jgi:antitoxin ChpS
MPHTARLRKVGGSVMLAIPPALLDALDLKSDASVGMSVKAGKLLVEPKTRPRYTLDDLLAQCSADARASVEERAWVDAPAAGREVI